MPRSCCHRVVRKKWGAFGPGVLKRRARAGWMSPVGCKSGVRWSVKTKGATVEDFFQRPPAREESFLWRLRGPVVKCVAGALSEKCGTGSSSTSGMDTQGVAPTLCSYTAPRIRTSCSARQGLTWNRNFLFQRVDSKQAHEGALCKQNFGGEWLRAFELRASRTKEVESQSRDDVLFTEAGFCH